MAKLPQQPETYDAIFAAGGWKGIYHLPYWESLYYPLNRKVLRLVRRRGVQTVLEVGCGTGAFAHLLMEKTRLGYRGFDFSPVAVARAAARTGRPECFFQGNATNPSAYEDDYDAIVCTEVLEHIPSDQDAVACWPSGCYCVCSVPNFDSDEHERFFRDETAVEDRYGKLLSIDAVTRITKPVLPIITWQAYARAIMDSRWKVRRLLDLAGVGSFERLGGWFVFAGTRR